MSEALRVWFASQDASVRKAMLSDSELEDARVFEAILYVVSMTTTLSQYEHLYNGAIMVLIKMMTIKNLRADQRACTPCCPLPSVGYVPKPVPEPMPRHVRSHRPAQCRASTSPRSERRSR